MANTTSTERRVPRHKTSMAGIVVHVKRESLAKAFSPGNMAALRVRTALDLPEEDSGGARGVVVRLGASRGTPLTVGRLSVTARGGAPAPGGPDDGDRQDQERDGPVGEEQRRSEQ